jgi:predicted transcriptional regulator
MEELAKRSTIRVIEIISEQERIKISDLARKSNLGYKSTNQNIKRLANMGLVRDYYNGNNRYIEPTFQKITMIFERDEKPQVKRIP